MQNSAGLLLIKSTKKGYLHANDNAICFYGLKNEKEIQNINDAYCASNIYKSRDYSPSELLNSIQEEDESVYRGNHLFILKALIVNQQLKIFLSHKSPLVNAKNKVEAVQLHFLELNASERSLIKSYITNPHIQMSKITQALLKKYNLLPQYTLTFSARENQCISYLLKGLSQTEIAEVLGLSRRTVEHYIENIKNKLGVTKVTEIIVKVLTEQLL